VDWYYKAAIVIALLWGAGRALGVYGEASRDLDLNFLTGFLLTMGGWAAVFYVIDRIAKFLGWKRQPADAASPAGGPTPPAADVESTTVARPTAAAPSQATPPRSSGPTRRTGRRSRR
jgi:hypothetical protein